jgi:hypothetical protein
MTVMRSSQTFFFLLLVSLVCLPARGATPTTASSAGPSYEIPKTPTPRVGDRLILRASVTCTAQAKSCWAEGGPGDAVGVGPEQKQTLEVEGTVQVLVVTDDRDTKHSLTVTRCVLTTDDGKQIELVAPGRTVVAELDAAKKSATDPAEQTLLSFPGGPTPRKEDLDLLRRVLQVDGPDTPKSDDIFGSDRPQHVGDTWPVNAELLVKVFPPGMTDATQIWGQVQLERVTKDEDGVPCVQIREDVEIKDCKLPSLLAGLDRAQQISGSAKMSAALLEPLHSDPAGLRARYSAADEYLMSVRHRDPQSGHWLITDYRWLTLRTMTYKPAADQPAATSQPAAATQPATQSAQ